MRKKPQQIAFFGGILVNEIMNNGDANAYEKSRFLVQGFTDNDNGLLTHAPTVQQAPQRLLLCLVTSMPDMHFFIWDISQAYTQSETKINWNIFVKPPASLNLLPGKLLQISTVLYVITEAGLYWFVKYAERQETSLGMTSTIHDQCFMYTPRCPWNSKPRRGITCIQTDDTENAGSEEFIAADEKESVKDSNVSWQLNYTLEIS